MGTVRRACARPGGRCLSSPDEPRRPRPTTSWQVLRLSGTAAELLAHGAELAGEHSRSGDRLSVICEVTDRAVVLGSAQSLDEVDAGRCAAAGASILKRRSGGGAVLVAPGAQLWVDVFLPAGDPLLDADVARSFLWLGRAWATALGAVLEQTAAAEAIAVAQPGAVATTRWSRKLCFGGLGAGEVTVDEHKVVGISQRRGRPGAWLYSMALLRDTAELLVDCLDLSDDERAEAGALLRERSGVLSVSPELLSEALLAALP